MGDLLVAGSVVSPATRVTWSSVPAASSESRKNYSSPLIPSNEIQVKPPQATVTVSDDGVSGIDGVAAIGSDLFITVDIIVPEGVSAAGFVNVSFAPAGLLYNFTLVEVDDANGTITATDGSMQGAGTALSNGQPGVPVFDAPAVLASNLTSLDDDLEAVDAGQLNQLVDSLGLVGPTLSGFAVNIGSLKNSRNLNASGPGNVLRLVYRATVLSSSNSSVQGQTVDLSLDYTSDTSVLAYTTNAPGLPSPSSSGVVVQSSTASVDIGVAQLDAFEVLPLAVANVDAGDTIEYNFTISHHPRSNSAAYSIIVSDDTLGVGQYEVVSVSINGTVHYLQNSTANQSVDPSQQDVRILNLPGPLPVGDDLEVEYVIRLTTDVQAGSGPDAGGFTLSPKLQVEFGSHPEDELATVDAAPASSTPSIGIRSPALGVDIDTGDTSPGALDAAPGQRFNVSFDIALPEGRLDLADVDVLLAAGPLRVIGASIVPSSPRLSSSCGSWDVVAPSLQTSGSGHAASIDLCNITNADDDNQGPAGPGTPGTTETLRVNILVEIDTLPSLLPGQTLGGGSVNLTSRFVPAGQITAAIPTVTYVLPVAATVVQARTSPAPAVAVDAGDLVEYSITITHDASSTSQMHDVAISDDSYVDGTGLAFDSSPLLELVEVRVDGRGLVFNESFAGTDVSVDPSRGLIAEIPTIDLGETVVIRVTARVTHSAEASSTIRPNAAMTYRTQPIAVAPLAGSVAGSVGADPQFVIAEPVVAVRIDASSQTPDDQKLVPGQTVDVYVVATVPESTILDATLQFELNPPGLLVPVDVVSMSSNATVTSTCAGGLPATALAATSTSTGSLVTVPLCTVLNAGMDNAAPDQITGVLRTYVSSSVQSGDTVAVKGTFAGVGTAPVTAEALSADLVVLEPLELMPVDRFPTDEISTDEKYDIVVDVVP